MGTLASTADPAARELQHSGTRSWHGDGLVLTCVNYLPFVRRIACCARSRYWVTLCYMTPTEYAAEKLAEWKRALQEQREVEAALATARKKRKHEVILELMPQVEFLRTKADLLLADAVRAKCLLGDQPFVPSEWLITAPDPSPGDQED